MNLLDTYSKILVTSNNINKHDNKNDKNNNNEDIKKDNHFRKLGEKIR